MAPPAVHGSRTRTTRGHWGRRPGGICSQSVPEGELRGDWYGIDTLLVGRMTAC